MSGYPAHLHCFPLLLAEIINSQDERKYRYTVFFLDRSKALSWTSYWKALAISTAVEWVLFSLAKDSSGSDLGKTDRAPDKWTVKDTFSSCTPAGLQSKNLPVSFRLHAKLFFWWRNEKSKFLKLWMCVSFLFLRQFFFSLWRQQSLPQTTSSPASASWMLGL